MGYPDIERARAGRQPSSASSTRYAGTRADLRRCAGWWTCAAKSPTRVEDEYCREKMRAIAEFGAELLSQPQPRARGRSAGRRFPAQPDRAPRSSCCRAGSTAWSAAGATASLARADVALRPSAFKPLSSPSGLDFARRGFLVPRKGLEPPQCCHR